MNTRHAISQKLIQCYSLTELLASSQYKHFKVPSVDITSIKARVLLLVKTGAGNPTWCVRGFNWFGKVSAG